MWLADEEKRDTTTGWDLVKACMLWLADEEKRDIIALVMPPRIELLRLANEENIYKGLLYPNVH